MQQRGKARGPRRSFGGARLAVIVVAVLISAFALYYVLGPFIAPSHPAPTSKITLNPSTDISGSMVVITGKNLTASQNVTATFDGAPLALSGTCETDSTGSLSGCSFLIPVSSSSGAHTVSLSDGTSAQSATLTIPQIIPPYSTILVSLTSLGLGVVTQLVTRKIVDLNAERKMKTEVSAFNKEKREATAAKDKAKLEKLKKRELQVRQAQTKISTARLKVTAITFVPLLGVYYLMSSFLGGFGVIVGYIAVPIPYIAGTPFAGGWEVSFFWWYFISSFTFSALLSRLLHTTT